MNKQIEALANRRLRWLNAIEAADVINIVYFLTENAEILLPVNITIKGQKAVRRWLCRFFRDFRSEWLISNTSRLVADKCALEKGSYNLSVIARISGEVVRHQGDYTVLWRFDSDHKWRVQMASFSCRTSTYKDRAYYFSECSQVVSTKTSNN